MPAAAVTARRAEPTTTTTAPPSVSRESTPRRILRRLADRVGLNEPVRRNLAARIQASALSTLGSLRVSSPGDPAEREAESTAHRVMTMGAPPVRPQGGPVLARAAAGPGMASASVSAEVARQRGGGRPLPEPVRRFMEPRFRADFRRVRIHTDDGAARLSRTLNAQAFTLGSDIFFARGRFNPDTRAGAELLAHELTHTIQQGAAAQEPQVSRSEDPTVHERSGPQAQRFGVSDALDYFAREANNIPGFRMFTIVLGVNPVNMSRVDRSAANIMRAVVEFLPGGALITQALDNNGVFDRVGNWVEQQIRTLGMTGSVIRDAINTFIDSLSWTDVFDLGGVWTRARRIFSEPIDRLIAFARNLVSQILDFIKDAILRPLARLAEGTRGYELLKAVLGRDPVTGDAVPRNAETLIGGFMRLIGQEEIWQNIQRSNSIGRAWAWFQGALSGLMGFVGQIPQMFLQAFRSLEIADIVLVPRAFERIASVFGGFIAQFLSWAGGTIWNLLEIIFEVVAPQVMVYLRRAQSAFRTILRDPIGFVRNLMRAGMLGLRQFATNFLTHLRASLIGWLTGAMAGANIYIPQGFAPMEIVKFVLSVLGLTWQNIRQKLVNVIGETAVTVLERTFDIVITLVTQGPAAAWEKIVESLTNLRDMVIEQVMTFVRDRVVQAAITKLLSMLSPVGAFIQAIIGIYNTVMFFIERMRQIAQVAAAVIDAIAAIAAGVVQPAANKVETTMAGLLTIVVSFLARIAGLGSVTDAITGIVNRIRQPIDRALDRVVNWIVTQARRLGRAIFGQPQAAAGAAGAAGGEIGETVQFSAGGEGHRLWVDSRARPPRVMLASSNPAPLSQHLEDFRTIAQQLEAGPTKTAVLAQIGTALPIARSIEQDAQRATTQQIDTQPRNDTDRRIKDNEERLRPMLAQILSALNITVPSQITPPIAVQFTRGANIDLTEYQRQLGDQAAAINQMMVYDWIQNRARFVERQQATGSGRDPASARIQEQFRATTRQQLIRRLTLPVNSTSAVVAQVNADPAQASFVSAQFAGQSAAIQAQGIDRSVAEAAVDSWMGRQAALHSPDQIAGGHAAGLTGMGSRSVNSSIGSNWRTLAGQLESRVVAAMGALGVQRPFWRRVKMNVSLNV
jgi:hypothetical protein